MTDFNTKFKKYLNEGDITSFEEEILNELAQGTPTYNLAKRLTLMYNLAAEYLPEDKFKVKELFQDYYRDIMKQIASLQDDITIGVSGK